MGKMAEQQRKLLEVRAFSRRTPYSQVTDIPLSTANDGSRGDGHHPDQCRLVGSSSMQELPLRHLSSRHLRKHRKPNVSNQV